MRQNYFAVLLMLAVAIVVAILVVEQRAATVMGEDWVNLTHLDIEQKFLHLMAHDVVTRTIVVVMLVLVALAFLGLSHLHLTAKPTHATHLNGNDLALPHRDHVLVRGTIVGAKQKANGYVTVKLQADDGAQVRAVIPPTVQVRVPKVGTRVQVSGTQTEPEMVTLLKRDDLRVLEAHVSQNQTLSATAYVAQSYPNGRSLLELT
ncbi:MAG: hypothetical protein UT15_C0014G0001, partial [Berkelbacteria bacterium GW2011_GWA1_39_10]